jgi:hypothetical protein
MNFEVNDIKLLNKIIKIQYGKDYIYDDINHFKTVIEYLEKTIIEFYSINNYEERLIEGNLLTPEYRILCNKHSKDIYFNNTYYYIKLLPDIIKNNLKSYTILHDKYKINVKMEFKESDEYFDSESINMKII